jgi:hypothetical protein
LAATARAWHRIGMDTLTTDRRNERASTRSGATFLLLDSLVGKGGVQAIALTNDAGVVVASTRGRFDADRMADAASGGEPLGATDVYAHPIDVHGNPFNLISAGGRVRRVREVTAALTRILTPR